MLSRDEVTRMRRLWISGEKDPSQLSEMFGVSLSTVYRNLSNEVNHDPNFHPDVKTEGKHLSAAQIAVADYFCNSWGWSVNEAAKELSSTAGRHIPTSTLRDTLNRRREKTISSLRETVGRWIAENSETIRQAFEPDDGARAVKFNGEEVHTDMVTYVAQLFADG